MLPASRGKAGAGKAAAKNEALYVVRSQQVAPEHGLCDPMTQQVAEVQAGLG